MYQQFKLTQKQKIERMLELYDRAELGPEIDEVWIGVKEEVWRLHNWNLAEILRNEIAPTLSSAAVRQVFGKGYTDVC